MRKIKIQEALKLKELPNKFLIHGEEEFLTRELIKRLSRQRPVEKFYPESLEEFLAFGGSSLFKGEAFPLILYGEELPGKLKKKAEREAFLKKLKELPSFGIAVFKKLEWKELSSGLFKEVTKVVELLIEAEPYTERQIYSIIAKKFKKEERELPQSVIKLIVEIVGTDLTQLKHETDKLLLYPGELTEEVVKELLFSSGRAEPFELIYPLIEGRKREFIERVEELLQRGIEPLQLVGLLQSQVRSLAEIAAGRRPRLPKEVYDNYRRLIRTKSLPQVLKLLKELHLAEFGLKTGELQGKEALISVAFKAV